MSLRTRSALLALAALTIGAPTPATAQAPDDFEGTVLVLNKSEATIHFIALPSGETVAELPTGMGPHELVTTSDGRLAIGTDYGVRGASGNMLRVWDVPTATEVRAINLGRYDRPHGIVVLAGDSLVAVTSETQGAVVIVRISDGEVVQILETNAAGSHMVGATADGETLWTGDMGSNTVTELSRSSGGIVRALDAPATPEAVNVTPSGDRVFAGSNATGRVTVFNTADGSAELVAEGFQWPYRMFLPPGGDQLIVPDYRAEELRFIDLDLYSELGRLSFPGGGPQGLTMYGDGRHLFLSLAASSRIAIVDTMLRRTVGYLPAGAGPDGIAWSPQTVSR